MNVPGYHHPPIGGAWGPQQFPVDCPGKHPTGHYTGISPFSPHILGPDLICFSHCLSCRWHGICSAPNAMEWKKQWRHYSLLEESLGFVWIKWKSLVRIHGTREERSNFKDLCISSWCICIQQFICTFGSDNKLGCVIPRCIIHPWLRIPLWPCTGKVLPFLMCLHHVLINHLPIQEDVSLLCVMKISQVLLGADIHLPNPNFCNDQLQKSSIDVFFHLFAG